MEIKSVLVADDIEQECVDILKQSGIAVTYKTKNSKEELIELLSKNDAILVRSATKVTADIIEAASGSLKVIGRAGTGVDNIDIEAASKYGVLVINTPQANSRSAAELTCMLILSLSRHIVPADASMKEGKWLRKDFMGEEVFGRTLAILGCGRIGSEVGNRLRAFGMRIVGYDPVLSKEQALERGIELLQLNEIWPIADYITVHVPLIPSTHNLINSTVLAKCKKGVRIINVARGGIINEEDLLAALDSGHVKGAALDVYEEEPPKFRALIEHPRAICTPHLGASTSDAQQRVATEIAENIIAINSGKILGAINAKEVGF